MPTPENKTERMIVVQFLAALAFVIVFSAICVAVWPGALAPVLIGSPFALLLYWQTLHVDDFRFGQHDEDTPFAPPERDRISYRRVDRTAEAK